MSDFSPAVYKDRDLYFFVSRAYRHPAIQVQSVAIGWQVYDMSAPLALGLVGSASLPMSF